MDQFSIGSRQVGPGAPCFVIGEVAQTHDGSLGVAHAFIDAIANAGADAVKLQTHIAAAESTPAEPWRVKFSRQDTTRFDYWKRMEFTEEQWQGLKQHADERGLVFLSSPFSIEAIDLLLRVGISAWKVASGEVSNTLLLRRMAETGLPILLSSGMSAPSELDAAVELAGAHGSPVAVLQCTSMYPVPPEKVGLNLIPMLRERYDCPVGLSDHTGTIYSGLAAVTLGISVLEVHVTLSREMFGPDVPASVTTDELCQLMEGIRFIERTLANPVDKEAMAQEMAPMRSLFTKSVVARMDLPAGTVLTEEHLTAKKPGAGIPVERMEELIGRRLKRPVRANEQMQLQDITEE